MKFITLLLVVCTTMLQAQDYKLGKVTVAELAEKFHPLDSTASAAILFKRGDVAFKIDNEGYWNVITEMSVKIKIYKKEGYKYANIEELIYSGPSNDRLAFSEEATYNLVNGKVEKTKLKSEGEFVEQKNKYWKSKKISLPNVKEGSVIEYKYTKTTYTLSRLPDFYFQYEIPANNVQYRVSVPEYFEYNRVMGGYLAPERKDETLNFTDLKYKDNRTTFSVKNAPAMKDEDFVNNIDNYRSSLKYELSSKKNQNGVIENFATTWDDVTAKIYDTEDFGRQLEKNSYFEQDVNALINGVTDRDEKVALIFNFVRGRMSWNEYGGYACDEGVRSAYKNKTGNVAEINLMLTAMLRYAGVNANPVLVSTRSNGVTQFPSRTAFNYVIAAVEIENDLILLDATSKNAQPNVIPIRALNWIGRIIRKNGSSAEVNLMPKMNSKESVNLMATINADGLVTGKIKDQYSDYNAYVYRENYLGLTKDSYMEKLEKKYSGIAVDEYVLTNDKELAKPLVETYSFTHTNLVEKIGDKMYFSPMLFLQDVENPFKQEKREYPVDFIYPRQDKYAFTITLPEGYVVESLPAAGMISMDENIGTFKYMIAAKANQLQLSVQYDINYAIVPADYYDTLKSFFKEMLDKQNEKIVLKKV